MKFWKDMNTCQEELQQDERTGSAIRATVHSTQQNYNAYNQGTWKVYLSPLCMCDQADWLTAACQRPTINPAVANLPGDDGEVCVRHSCQQLPEEGVQGGRLHGGAGEVALRDVVDVHHLQAWAGASSA